MKKSTHLPNLKVDELALNKGYIAVLTLKYRTEHYQILSWKEYIALATVLLEHIEKELKEKS